MTRITFFSELPGGACHKYRVEAPIKWLRRNEGLSCVYKSQWTSDLKECDLFIFQRNSSEQALKILYSLQQQGHPVIYDIDDNILHIPLSNPVMDLYLKTPRIPWDQLMCMRFASFVTVSTPELREVYQHINPNILVVPNYLDPDDWSDDIEPLMAHDRIRIFWGGSPTHKEDVGIIKDAMSEIKRRYPEVEFIIMGDGDMDLGCEVTHIPFGPYKFFQRVMVSCQIGLAPMVDNLFNQGKSALRVMELAASGLAIAASPVGEYAGKDEFCDYATTTDEWIGVLSHFIEDEIYRVRSGKSANRWVRENCMIDQNLGFWLDVFERLGIHDDDIDRGSVGEVVRIQDNQRSATVPDTGKVRMGGFAYP